jgi:small subunit ribosomal protein S20
MANHKQADKRHRQSLRRKARNKHYKSAMRTYLKRARVALEEKAPNADEAVRKAVSMIDKVAQKGVIHRNTAARTISRLLKSQSA